jgi:Surface antigen variable number repeat
MPSEDLSQARLISRIDFRGCSKDTQTELLSRMPIRPGDLLSEEMLEQARQVAKAFDPPLEIFVDQTLPREAYLKLSPEVRGGVRPPNSDDGVNLTIYDPGSVPRRIRIESRAQQAMLLERVMPPDPATGVQLTVVIGRDGTVVEVGSLDAPAFAIDAVKQWRYRPMLLNGLPVEVQTTVEL